MTWTKRCLVALAVFQVVIGVLLWLNWDVTVQALTGTRIAPTEPAAEGAALGSLVVHGVLAVASLLCARRVPRVRTTVLCVLTAVGGVAAMWLPSQTYLSPIGVALATAVVCLIWIRPAPRPAAVRPR
jgi:hypothetical protein